MTILNVAINDIIDPDWGNSVANEINARGVKDYASITADQGSITTETDVTGLTVTWTASTSRLYRISFAGQLSSSVNATDWGWIKVTDSSNNAKVDVAVDQLSSGLGKPFHGSVFETGLSGSITRKLRAARLAGTGNISVRAATTSPAFILVEDIGPA